MQRPLFLICAVLMLLAGCEKNDSVAPQATADDGNTPLLYTLMRQNAAQVQQFELLPTAPATQFTTVHGAVITLKGSAFVRYDNSPMSASPVKLRVEEVTDRAGMLFTWLPTVTVDWEGGQLLESAGMIQIKATQDDKPLDLVQGETIRLTTRNPSALSTPAGMQLYTSYVGPAGDFGWQSVPANLESRIQPNVTNTGFEVVISNQLFNNAQWINLDRLVPGPFVAVQVQTSAQDRNNGDFTHVYLSYKDLNSLTHTPYMTDGGLATMRARQGARVTAIVVRTTAGQTCYYGEQTATVTAPFTFTPKLVALPAADIITRIRQATQ